MTRTVQVVVLLFLVLALGADAHRGGWRKRKCRWVRCERNCKKVKDEEGCYTCECEPTCTPPKCSPGCEIEKEFVGDCPGCICDDGTKDEGKPKIPCDPPKCPVDCQIQTEYEGPCPECDCSGIGILNPRSRVPICSPSKCRPGCFLQQKFDGLCPECECPKHWNRGGWKKRKCRWVKCKRNCRKVKDEEGCPKCECEPVCSPPKCGPGCEIENVFIGGCPGCICKDDGARDAEKPKIPCDPPKCPDGCEIQTEYEGPCPECDCSGIGILSPRSPRPLCPPTECKPGCFVQQKLDSPCPECECPKHEIKDVPPCPADAYFRITLVCDKNCRKIKDENGCEICNCEPGCPHPHCPKWCKIKEIEDGCPICECSRRKDFWKRTRCPNVGMVCIEPCSRQGTDENGCMKCICDDLY